MRKGRRGRRKKGRRGGGEEGEGPEETAMLSPLIKLQNFLSDKG